ncbi:MAG: response regulator, partial [Spirochaetaceae bacterium]|nr:response regulator [Spirochaetaceae bacterium]
MKETKDMVAKKTILVIDDMADNLALIRGLLAGRYRTLVALNGEKGLRLANSQDHPDLILLDVMMPEMDGYEVCRRLKDSPATAGIPIVFLTAKQDAEDEERGLTAGAADFLTKP